MKFEYARFGKTLRPVIPIKIKNGNKKIDYQVLVDSGADLCLFHTEVGEAIGINIKSGKISEVFGVGGKASVYYVHKITIEIGGWEYEIEAGFLPDIGNRMIPYGIVGQRGFFENFIVKFDLLKEEIEIKRREK